jgi:hypothetical protein
MKGKTYAIPSLHRDSFAAKVPGFCPDAASGNATSLYCRPLGASSDLIYLQFLIKTSNIKDFGNE